MTVTRAHASRSPLPDLSAFLEGLPDCYLVLGPDLTIRAVTDAYLRATMTERAAIVDRPLFAVFPDDPAIGGARRVRASLESVLATRGRHEIPIQRYDIRRPDGGFEERWWKMLSVPLLGTDGEVSCIIHRVKDITALVRERRETSEAIRDREERLAGVLAAIDDAFYAVDREERFTHVSRRALEMWGRAAGEVIGRRVLEVLPGVENGELYRALRKTLETGRPQHCEAISLSRSDRWVEQNAYPTPGGGAAVAFRDIDERKRAEGERERLVEQLASERARFATLIEHLPVGVGFVDAEGRVVLDNPAFRRTVPGMAGSSMGESGGEWTAYGPGGRHLPPSEYPAARALRGEIVHGVECVHRSRGGFERWLRVSGIPVRDAGGELAGALAVVIDIDGEKRAEAALRELNQTLEQQVEERARQLAASRARLRAFFDNSPDWLTLQRVTRDGRFVYEDLNPACEAAYGMRRDEVIGRTVEEVLGKEPAQLPLRHFRECVRTGLPQRYVARRTMSGNSYTIDVMFAPVPGELDGERFIITTARDVTDREQLEEQLRQAQKMEAVGQLTGGIAHDFNNLLTAISGNLELLEMHVTDERPRRMLQSAFRAAQRGARLNAQLLAFSRKQHLAPTSVDLNRSVADMEDLLGRTIGVAIEIRTRLAEDLWPALVDPTQLELVVLNLAINARDAMPGGGVLTIETRNVAVAEIDRTPDLAAGDYVLVSVADTGTGMSEAVLERAFEPFFTTKEPGKGSGLGLSQVYGVARQSGGAVRVRSRVGQGTVVEVYLPRASGRAARVPDAGEDESIAGSRATVLVLDDEADVRDVAVAHLETLGYRALAASTGKAALETLGGEERIDLLIVDYAMPGRSGVEIMREARERWPDLPMLLLTGYADTGVLDREVDAASVLRKPYRMHELASRVEAALKRGTASPRRDSNVVPIKS